MNTRVSAADGGPCCQALVHEAADALATARQRRTKTRTQRRRTMNCDAEAGRAFTIEAGVRPSSGAARHYPSEWRDLKQRLRETTQLRPAISVTENSHTVSHRQKLGEPLQEEIFSCDCRLAKRCRVGLATAVQRFPCANIAPFMDCAGRAKRRRRYGTGNAHGQSLRGKRIPVTTASKKLPIASRLAGVMRINWPAFIAPANCGRDVRNLEACTNKKPLPVARKGFAEQACLELIDDVRGRENLVLLAGSRGATEG